jgi:hypothetical protein
MNNPGSDWASRRSSRSSRDTKRRVEELSLRYWRGSGPEWDVVASSLDGKRLLLGEAKWLFEPADSSVLAGIAAELKGKGNLPFELAGKRETVWSVFVPELKRGCRPPAGIQVLEAASILSCLR